MLLSKFRFLRHICQYFASPTPPSRILGSSALGAPEERSGVGGPEVPFSIIDKIQKISAKLFYRDQRRNKYFRDLEELSLIAPVGRYVETYQRRILY